MLSKSIIKYIQSLQHKKFRTVEKLFVAEGPKLVGELLQGKKFRCRNVYAVASWKPEFVLPDNCLVERIADFELEKISSLSTPNQVLALFEIPEQTPVTDLNKKFTLVLDDVQDPGNLGTIIRIADWFGVEHIICSLQTADQYNAKVVQSTMASLQNVQLFYTDLPTWLAGTSDVPIYAASLGGEPLQQFSNAGEGIIIIGNESKGISPELLKMATTKINIGRIGQAESLNAAVATGIIMYEFTRSKTG
jgi:RNA methyltransferase, TrmH family